MSSPMNALPRAPLAVAPDDAPAAREATELPQPSVRSALLDALRPHLDAILATRRSSVGGTGHRQNPSKQLLRSGGCRR